MILNIVIKNDEYPYYNNHSPDGTSEHMAPVGVLNENVILSRHGELSYCMRS